MTEDNKDMSEFNDSIGYLNRINAMFYSCTEASFNQSSATWSRSLLRLFNELSGFMEKETYTKNYEQIRNIFRIISEEEKKKSRRHDNEEGTINIKLYWMLNDYELEMRRIYKDSGLQIKLKEDDLGTPEEW